VSVGDAAAVDGEESAVVEVTVLFKRLRWGIAVEAIVISVDSGRRMRCVGGALVRIDPLQTM